MYKHTHTNRSLSVYLTNQIIYILPHFRRLVGLLEGTKGTVVYGGDTDPQTRYFQPTVVTDVAPDDKLMEVGVASMW